MSRLVSVDKEYAAWLKELKDKIRSVQIKAAVQVNIEMLNFYWELGKDIVGKQAAATWGDGFLAHLSDDLLTEFPNIKGFSVTNLKYMKQWYLYYNQGVEISQQPVGQIAQQLVTQIQKGHRGGVCTQGHT